MLELCVVAIKMSGTAGEAVSKPELVGAWLELARLLVAWLNELLDFDVVAALNFALDEDAELTDDGALLAGRLGTEGSSVPASELELLSDDSLLAAWLLALVGSGLLFVASGSKPFESPPLPPPPQPARTRISDSKQN